MPKQSSRRLSESERAERRRQDRERLQQAAAELLSSEGWARWVRTRAMFHSYSAGNCMLLAAQCHQRGIVPTRIAGFRTWLKLGRVVRKGETALRILAPIPLKQGNEQAGEDSEERRVLFRTAFVFDRLSRVRSGGCRRRPSWEIRCLPVSRPCCSSAPASRLRGRLWPARSSRSRRPRATAQRRSRARPAGTPGNRSALTRCRECRHPVPIPAISRTDGKSPKAAALHQEQPASRARPVDRFTP